MNFKYLSDRKMNLSKKRMLDDNRRKQWEIQKAAFDARISEMKSGDSKTRDGESRDNNNTRDGTDTVIPNEAPEHQKSEMMWFQSENEEHTKDMLQSTHHQSVESHDQSNQIIAPAQSQQPDVPELPPKLKFMLDMMEKNGKLTPEKKAFFMKMVAKKRAQEIGNGSKPEAQATGNSLTERNNHLEKEATKKALAALISKRKLQAPTTAPTSTAPPPQATMTPETNLSAKALLLQRLAAKQKAERDSSIESLPGALVSTVTMNPSTVTTTTSARPALESKAKQPTVIGKTTTKLRIISTIKTTSSTPTDPRAAFFARFNKQTTTAVPITVTTLIQTTSDPRAAFFARFNKPTTTALPITEVSETPSDPRAAFLSKIRANNIQSESVNSPTQENTDLTQEQKIHLARKEFFKKKMAKKAAAGAASTKSPMTTVTPFLSKPSGPPASFLANMSPEKREFFMKMMAKKKAQSASASAVIPTPLSSTPVVNDGPTLMEQLRAKMISKASLSTTSAPTQDLITKLSDVKNDDTISINSRNLLMQKLAEKKMLEMSQESERIASSPLPSSLAMTTTIPTAYSSISVPKKSNSRFERRERKQKRKQSNQVNSTTGSAAEVTTVENTPEIDNPPEDLDPRKAFMLKMMNKSPNSSQNSIEESPSQPTIDSSNSVDSSTPSNDESLDAKKAFFQRMMAAKSQNTEAIPKSVPESSQSDFKASFMSKLNSMRTESQSSLEPVDIPPTGEDSSTGIPEDKKAFLLKMLAKKRGRRTANGHLGRYRREHLYWQPISAQEILNGI